MADIANDATIEVVVIYVQAQQTWERTCRVSAGATIWTALQASAFVHTFPQIDPGTAGVGIFGVRKSLQTVLADGDRVEVYRPLVFDPMVSRRRRATHKRARKA